MVPTVDGLIVLASLAQRVPRAWVPVLVEPVVGGGQAPVMHDPATEDVAAPGAVPEA